MLQDMPTIQAESAQLAHNYPMHLFLTVFAQSVLVIWSTMDNHVPVQQEKPFKDQDASVNANLISFWIVMETAIPAELIKLFLEENVSVLLDIL